MAIALVVTKNFSSSLQSTDMGDSHEMSGSWFLFHNMISCLITYIEFRVKQKILYVPRPDLLLRSSPAQISVKLPEDVPPTSIPSMSSWPQQKFPAVVVSGVIFNRAAVEVECKVGNAHLMVLYVRLSLIP